MITVDVSVSFSKLHGMGLFARRKIPAGTVVWVFNPNVDSRVPLDDVDEETLGRGYINPARPDDVVVCGDAAGWMNFAHDANCVELFKPTRELESVIVAARDIEVGDELTITTESDADAERKLRN